MIRRKRRAYLDHFTKTASGEYVYAGGYYAFQDAGKSRKRALAELWICWGCATAAILAGGCIPAPGVGSCAYVLIPYVAAVIAAFSMLWAVGQLTAGGDPLREYVYRDSVEKLPRRSLATAVCALLALAGEGVYLALHSGQAGAAWGAGFLALMAVSAGAALWCRSAILRLKWTKNQGD